MPALRRFTPVIASVAAVILLGCSHNSSSNDSKSAAGLRLKQGPAPLTYLVAQGGGVTVRDQTAGKTIARATVAPSTPITVDTATGVTMGSKVVKKGPLPADHRYEILLDKSP